MCQILDDIIENPALLEEGKMPQHSCCTKVSNTGGEYSCEGAFGVCEGCAFILNWLLGYGPHGRDGTLLSSSEFLLACIEKRAELEVNLGLPKRRDGNDGEGLAWVRVTMPKPKT